tara:strand:+ start:81 stop:620 length:540 start_codon:yes stop_codon:yes gene_type:complete
MFNYLSKLPFDSYNYILSFLEKKQINLLVLGLENSGKSTLVKFLKDGKIKSLTPTNQPNICEFFNKNKSLIYKVYDIGGHKLAKNLWENYSYTCDCILFIIDTTDIEKLEEVKIEIDKLVTYKVPILVIGNKIDMNGISKEELYNFLELKEYNIELIMISIINNVGINVIDNWIEKLFL